MPTSPPDLDAIRRRFGPGCPVDVSIEKTQELVEMCLALCDEVERLRAEGGCSDPCYAEIVKQWWCKEHEDDPLPVKHSCPDCDKQRAEQAALERDAALDWKRDRESTLKIERVQAIGEVYEDLEIVGILQGQEGLKIQVRLAAADRRGGGDG